MLIRKLPVWVYAYGTIGVAVGGICSSARIRPCFHDSVDWVHLAKLVSWSNTFLLLLISIRHSQKLWCEKTGKLAYRDITLASVRQYVSTSVCQYVSTSVRQYAIYVVWLQYVSTSVRQYASMSVRQYVSTPVCQYVSTSVPHVT